MHGNVDVELIEDAGFTLVELAFGSKEYTNELARANMCGVCIKVATQPNNALIEAARFASEKDCYIVLDTREIADEELLFQYVSEAGVYLAEKQIPIYIENGYIQKNGKYTYGAYSDAEELIGACNELEKRYPGIQVGAAIDIGNANVLSKNIADMIMQLGSRIKLIHVNDNDGGNCQRQMPFTFTTGRGHMATDWNRILGALMKTCYDGYFIFNTTGLYDVMPKPLIPEMLRLQKALADRFEKQFHFEDVLAQEGKQIVLFGAGAMATNYMKTWGEKYPPVFVVDNNAKRWGESFYETEIKSPDEIMRLDQNKRLVLICNSFYNEIRKQLTQMGVAYEYYNDEFY